MTSGTIFHPDYETRVIEALALLTMAMPDAGSGWPSSVAEADVSFVRNMEKGWR